MPNNGYFDCQRDRQLITSGTHFWCYGHLAAVLVSEQSADPRYCQACYEFLLKEIETDTSRRGSDWKPKKTPKDSAQVSEYIRTNMSTLKYEKIEVDIITTRTATRTLKRRGPKRRELPENYIMELAARGMGSKAIAGKLKTDKGIAISYKTVQRILSGQRVLV